MLCMASLDVSRSCSQSGRLAGRRCSPTTPPLLTVDFTSLLPLLSIFAISRFITDTMSSICPRLIVTAACISTAAWNTPWILDVVESSLSRSASFPSAQALHNRPKERSQRVSTRAQRLSSVAYCLPTCSVAFMLT